MKKIFLLSAMMALLCTAAFAQKVTIPLNWDEGVSLPFIYVEEAFQKELNVETGQEDTTITTDRNLSLYFTVSEKDENGGYEIQLSFSDVIQEAFDNWFYVFQGLENQTVKFKTDAHGNIVKYLNMDEVLSFGRKALRGIFSEAYSGAIKKGMLPDTTKAPREEFIRAMQDKQFTEQHVKSLIHKLFIPFIQYTESTFNTAEKYYDTELYESVVNPADTVKINKVIKLDATNLEYNRLTITVYGAADDTDAMAWAKWKPDDLTEYLKKYHYTSGERAEYAYSTDTGLLYRYVYESFDKEDLKKNNKESFLSYISISITLDDNALWGEEDDDYEDEE